MIKCTLQWSHFINQLWKHLFCNNYVQGSAESLEVVVGAPCTYTKSQEEIRGWLASDSFLMPSCRNYKSHSATRVWDAAQLLKIINWEKMEVI